VKKEMTTENEKWSVRYDAEEGNHFLVITERHIIPLHTKLVQGQDIGGWNGWEIDSDGIHRVNKMKSGEVLSDVLLSKDEFEQDILDHICQAGEVIFPLRPGTY